MHIFPRYFQASFFAEILLPMNQYHNSISFEKCGQRFEIFLLLCYWVTVCLWFKCPDCFYSVQTIYFFLCDLANINMSEMGKGHILTDLFAWAEEIALNQTNSKNQRLKEPFAFNHRDVYIGKQSLMLHEVFEIEMKILRNALLCFSENRNQCIVIIWVALVATKDSDDSTE